MTGRRPDDEASISMPGAAMTLTCIVFLALGLGWPQAAGALLRILLIALAVGFVAARAYDAMLRVGTRRKEQSPFDRDAGLRKPPAAPQVLRNLALDLSNADDARRSKWTGIPWPVRRTVIHEASRRLAEHHGLRFSDPSHHARIRALVSEPMWELIGHPPPEQNSGAQRALARATRERPGERGRAVPLSELDLILDDLERL